MISVTSAQMYLCGAKACVRTLLLQACLTLCESMDCRQPGYSTHEILQARILEWVAMSSSRGSFPPRDRHLLYLLPLVGGLFTIWCKGTHPRGVCSVVSDSVTSWTVAARLLCSWNFPGKNTGVPFSTPGGLPNPGMETKSPESPSLASGLYHHATWQYLKLMHIFL